MSQYAQKEDLPATIQRLSLDEDEITSALVQNSGVVDGFLCKVFTLPLTKWGSDITHLVVHLAAYDLAVDNGLNPDDPANKTFKDRADEAQKRLKDIADGSYSPQGVFDSSNAQPDVYGGEPTVMYPASAQRRPGHYDGPPSSTPKPRGY